MSKIDKQHERDDQEIHFRDVSPALEFVFWIALAFTPFLRWVNGPAVSMDQFILQLLMVAAAVVGAISLRLYHCLSNRGPS
jgi:hypothetical protein